MRGFKKFTFRRVGVVIILLILLVLNLMPGRIPLIGGQMAYAYNEVAHQWILRKAIEYLKDKERPVVSEFPLDDYLPSLSDGVEYADQAAEIRCEWKGFNESNCDTIHHYGHIDDIETVAGITVAHPGEFAAPDYAEALFEQAIKFWPGGLEPSLSALLKKDAGKVQVSFFPGSIDLGDTWVGGFPFCEDWVKEQGFTASQACPKWPSWAASDITVPIEQRYTTYRESIENAMKYLGWSIHMIEDMTVPHHAQNNADTGHQEYEDYIDDWIDTGELDDLLPAPITGSYEYGHNPVAPDYFDKEDGWSAKQFALEARRIASEHDPAIANMWTKHYGEYYVDMAIKLVAAVIEKYFTCAPPSSGDWVIPNRCICRRTYTAPANVLVPDGAVLIVPDDVTLDIDFKNHSLKVKEGGGVLIREGGRIH